MNYYIVSINHENRNGEYTAKSICFVKANTEDEARDKAWSKCGSDYSCIKNVYYVENFEESEICEFYTR